MSKHRRESTWSAFVSRVRDLHDKVMPAEDRYQGKHRDNSPQALATDVLTAVGAL